ncbi:MAG: hypothetical protein PHS59_08920 [Paludibacter sp.]|nr:hypothetical protein [Paludibacter sp.]
MEILLGVVYNKTKNKIFVFVIVFVIIVVPLLNHISDNKIFGGNICPILRKLINNFNSIIAAFLIITQLYFSAKKNDLLIKYSQKVEEKKEIDEQKIDEQKLQELVTLAYKNHLNFVVLFEEYYPLFTNKIKDLIPCIVISEFEVIALLKLNFSTKEIACITNSSVRAIESKKYRIRKKINIPSDTDMNLFFSEL